MPLLRLPTVEPAPPESGQAPKQPAASSPPAIQASGLAIVIGYVAVAIGIVVGWVLYEVLEPSEFVPAAGTSAFALLFVFAAAIERFVEPLSFIADRGKVGSEDDAPARQGTKATAIKHRNDALATALETTNEETQTAKLKEAADWQRLIERIRRDKAVIMWGVASLLAALISGALGVFLLEVLGFDVHPAVDVAVTGLAIGSGTKPLHELVKSLQTAKEEKKDPAEVGGRG